MMLALMGTMWATPASPSGISRVSAASAPYAAGLRASSPKMGIPADTPTCSPRSSEVARGLPSRISRIDMRLMLEWRIITRPCGWAASFERAERLALAHGRAGRRLAIRRHAHELAQHVGVTQLLRPQLAQDRALLDDQHALGQLGDELEVLLDQEDRHPLAVVQLAQDADQLLDDRRLDAFGRLVEEDQLRLAGEAARDGQQLLLATAQRAAPAIEQRRQAREGGQD